MRPKSLGHTPSSGSGSLRHRTVFHQDLMEPNFVGQFPFKQVFGMSPHQVHYPGDSIYAVIAANPNVLLFFPLYLKRLSQEEVFILYVVSRILRL